MAQRRRVPLTLVVALDVAVFTGAFALLKHISSLFWTIVPTDHDAHVETDTCITHGLEFAACAMLRDARELFFVLVAACAAIATVSVACLLLGAQLLGCSWRTLFVRARLVRVWPRMCVESVALCVLRVAVLAAVALLLVPGRVSTQHHWLRGGDVQWATLAHYVVVSPIVEELAFRHVVLHVVWQRTGRKDAAAAVSAVAFGAYHAVNALWGTFALSYVALQVLVATVVGWYLCGAALHSHTLWDPLLCHVVNNAVASLYSPAAAIDTIAVASITLTLATHTLAARRVME